MAELRIPINKKENIAIVLHGVTGFYKNLFFVIKTSANEISIDQTSQDNLVNKKMLKTKITACRKQYGTAFCDVEHLRKESSNFLCTLL